MTLLAAPSDPRLLSAGQRQFLSMFAADPHDPAYNVPLALRLRGPLDVAAMRRAFQSLVTRHEILRTGYDLSGREPQAVLRGADELDYVYETSTSSIDDLVRRWAAEPLDLTTSPLRVRLVQLGPDDHLLVAVIHHIACDGPSQHVILSQLSELYSAPTEETPTWQYADYVRSVADRPDDTEFWRTTLTDLAATELPTDRPRTDRRGHVGATVPIRFALGTADQIGELCRSERSTPYVVLLTAFQILLARYTGSTDVCVGTSVSLRDRAEFDGLIGYLANTVVMRHRWRRGSFRDLVGSCRGQVLDALDHAATPLAAVAALTGRAPFAVMFDLRQGDPPPLSLPGVTVELVSSTDGVARFELTAHLHEADGVLSGELEYSTDLFDRTTAQRMADQYGRLLDRLTRSPDTPVHLVDVHSDDERSALLVRGEDAIRPLFDLRGEPAAIAVTDGVSSLSYRELDRQANRYAHWLVGKGVRPGDLIGVRLPRTPELLGALLGVWRAGAAYVPIDPAHPAGRVQEIIEASQVRLIVEAGLEVAAEPDTSLGLELEPLGPAYVMFTSGSTGRPKGVMVTHAGVANYLGWVREAYARRPGGAPFFSSIGFDLGVPNLFAPLLQGETVRLIPDGFDTAELGELLSAGAPYSFVKLTPGHLDLLSQQLSPAQAADFAGLVIAAGDEFPKRLVERWTELGGPPLASEYGPTEITVGNSAQFGLTETRTQLVPLGRPIPNTTMYVLDADLMPCPVGVIGEVYIGGDGVALGYVGQPGLTADRFLPDPYGASSARLYRTGDLARVLPDGAVDFVGRSDHQVKVRGYRIELDEIEGALAAQPGVRDVVVAVRDDRLVGYLTGEPDIAQLRAALADRLPPYMLPAAYLVLAAIPLTDNGKVDRGSLPAPDRGEFVADDYVSLDGAVERDIAARWSEVLEVEQVGALDSFFELGGDSVSAVALAGQLRAAGFDLSVADVFSAHTVRALAALVAERAPAVTVESVAPFGQLGAIDRAALPADVVDAYPIGLTQRGMLLEMLAGGDRNYYHNITVFRIRDEQPLDQAALRRAVDRVVAHHDVMRTTFDLTSYAEPLQLVHTDARMPLEFSDVSGLDDAATDRLLHAHCRRERAELFCLDQAPLMRMHVFTGSECWWLAITECHPILEGWSYHNQLMELLQGYQRARDGLDPATIENTPIRFADFIATERTALADPAEQAYWRGVLTEYERVEVPTAWGDPSAVPERYQVHVELTELESGLRELARLADVPYKSVLLAAHLQVLSRISAVPSFHAGVVCDARPELPGFERVSGMYLNSVPFQHRPGARTWMELAQQTFRTEIDMWPHRHFPSPAMPTLVPGSPRPVDILFHYLDFHQVDTELVDVAACIDDSPNEFRLVVGTPMPGRLTIASSADVVRPEQAERLAGYYQTVLTSMARDPQGDPDLLALFETSGWTGPDAPEAVLDPVLQGAPEAVAVMSGDQSFTVAEVQRRADLVTDQLLADGIGADDVVGLLFDRDVDLVAAILGVLAAGAAYLPLDPAQPDARLRDLAYPAAAQVIAAPGYVHRLTGAVAIRPTTHSHPRPMSDPDTLAYLMPTSGTTAGPKLVGVTRRGLAGYLRHAAEQYGGSAPVLSSAAFDITVPSLLVPLLGGATVFLPPSELDPADLGGWLAAHAPFGFIEATASQYHLLLSQLGPTAVRQLAPVLVSAGEAVDAELVRRLPGLRVEYGPTEATVGVCHGPAEVNALGEPISGTTVRLLDTELRPVPEGVVGQLYLSGSALARGYLGRAAATAQAWLPDPFGPAGDRMYATGDRARFNRGRLEFVGRCDDQVKRNGYRIEPSEIVGALLRDPRVERAVVRFAAGRLIGYVQTDTATDEQLLADLRLRLPAHLVPDELICRPSLAITANGKLDRRQSGPDRPSPNFRPPATDQERMLAAIWQRLTGAERIGRDDSLREVAGDSLMVLQVIAEAERVGLSVPRQLIRDGAPLHSIAADTRSQP